ncbi:hypothetical protein [Aquitalea palustris]|uniref:hypothetical protein n=1 Tax=Aquitalea palustris TaxID=2480983 RepID=UPI001CF0CDD1|nr:hypothetical protein [Aquitalea palustris]
MMKPNSRARISEVMEQSGGGIYKQIDTHREFVELLRRVHPEFLGKHPYAANWLAGLDDFLVGLASAGAHDPERCRYRPCSSFPRVLPMIRVFSKIASPTGGHVVQFERAALHDVKGVG